MSTEENCLPLIRAGAAEYTVAATSGGLAEWEAIGLLPYDYLVPSLGYEPTSPFKEC